MLDNEKKLLYYIVLVFYISKGIKKYVKLRCCGYQLGR